MASRLSYLAVLILWITALWLGLDFAAKPRQPQAAVPTTQVDWVTFFAAHILPELPVAEELGPPLRPPDGSGAFVTLPFGAVGQFLGEDWAIAKGDGSFGEPVYSIGDGWVSVAQDFNDAFGKVIFICYRFPPGRFPPFIEVMYAQLQTIDVTAGAFVKRGQRIGTIGNAAGIYSVSNGASGAHLHWEVRQTVGLGKGPGFDNRHDGWLEPSQILAAHRGTRAKIPLLMQVIPQPQWPQWPSDY